MPLHGDLPLEQITRVMSPNGETNLQVAVPQRGRPQHELQPWGLRATDVFWSCEVCSGDVAEVWVCSACYRAGHARCLDAVVIEGYAFCHLCKDWAQTQHDRNTTEIQKQ
eukprot:6774736-Pyramimonas_sp.AAC.1